MRDETPDETAVINHYWQMARHTVTACCGRYKQCNRQRMCRMCARKALMALSVQMAEQPTPDDDLSYYDTPQETPA